MPGDRGCWWGERKMLTNLLAGMPLPEAGLYRNPNLQNIAAWTRADSFGYALPGWPEKAAELAWRDASANHRRNGVYGSMFMAATISAAFAVDDPMEAVRIGLSEIPKDCLFAEGDPLGARAQVPPPTAKRPNAVWNQLRRHVQRQRADERVARGDGSRHRRQRTSQKPSARPWP